MKTYLLLLRAINVGGKNKIPMADLRSCLEEQGFFNVTTYIASGNVIIQSNKSARKVKEIVESVLPERFTSDSELIKVLVLTTGDLREVIQNKPRGFGDEPKMHHSDVIFMIDLDVSKAMKVFDPRDGVDSIWPGSAVIYSQRLSSLRTKSRLNKVIGSPLYKSMTIRTWNTTTKLLEMMNDIENK